MCLSAIIWSNIKKVYYGNTKEDAANIGFRDETIYDFIKNLDNENGNSDLLELECLDRDETIEIFNKYMEKNDKTMY
jgi:tRNA(Arg) A34 adenosine deaminase TadA